MSFLLDTNVVSELVRSRPDRRVVEWIQGVPDGALYLSVLTLGEIRNGIEGLPAGHRKERLTLWLERELPAWFEDRLLTVTAAIAHRWGRLVAAAGRPVPAIDSLLAATALGHGLRLATRNEADFRFPELAIVNPWHA